MDLFYYGSQDIPLPMPGGRDPLSHPDDLFCESCSAAVSPEDLTAGRASEFYGLVLCESCRLMTRAEEKIELYFCDRCHVSVPVYRVDTGEALAGDGRILCVRCRSLEPRRALRGIATTALATLLVITVAVLATQLIRIRLADAPTGEARDIGPFVRRLDRILTDTRLAEGAGMDALKARTSELVTALDGFWDGREEVRSRLAELNAGLVRMQTELRLRSERLEGQIRLLEQTVDKLDRESDALR